MYSEEIADQNYHPIPVEAAAKPRSQQLFEEAFSGPRDPRSAEYKAGVLYILQLKAGEIASTPCPYPLGTAQADAWLHGCGEGRKRWQWAAAADRAERTTMWPRH